MRTSTKCTFEIALPFSEYQLLLGIRNVAVEPIVSQLNDYTYGRPGKKKVNE